MKYKIVKKNRNEEYTERFDSVKEAEEFLQDDSVYANNLKIVPETYQFCYSFRNNGYRWMEPIDI